MVGLAIGLIFFIKLERHLTLAKSEAENILSEKQITWKEELNNYPPKLAIVLADLAFCESGFNEKALNPNDLDNTPSYGLFQFKPSTLYFYALKYQVLSDIEQAEIQNVIYDGSIQLKTVAKMIENRGHKESFWLQQFPGCYKKYKDKWNKLNLL